MVGFCYRVVKDFPSRFNSDEFSCYVSCGTTWALRLTIVESITSCLPLFLVEISNKGLPTLSSVTNLDIVGLSSAGSSEQKDLETHFPTLVLGIFLLSVFSNPRELQQSLLSAQLTLSSQLFVYDLAVLTIGLCVVPMPRIARLSESSWACIFLGCL